MERVNGVAGIERLERSARLGAAKAAVERKRLNDWND